jgi:hypothetical protein
MGLAMSNRLLEWEQFLQAGTDIENKFPTNFGKVYKKKEYIEIERIY